MTVSELNQRAKSYLESNFNNINLQGEVSKFTIHSSNHWYFTLKDKESSISCVMFSSLNYKMDFVPSIGELLELNGKLSVYPASGTYQFVVSHIQKAGNGELEARFLALKKRLEKEGLFEKKQALPKFPKSIGIITSKTSAALQDMLKIIRQKNNFLSKIYIFNSLTQGNEAPNSLIKALQKADNFNLDLIIIARGGGSREDLFCFNDETLAREIFKAKTPIISAIGHEIDYVISDFVADYRSPTPSAAINVAITSRDDLEQGLDLMYNNLDNVFKIFIKKRESELANLWKFFKVNSLPKSIQAQLNYNENLFKQMKCAINNKLKQTEFKLESLENAFLQYESFFKKSKDLISITKNGKVLNLSKLKTGDEIELHSQNEHKKAKIL
ncbi:MULTISPECIES: exodeoxyribonuclease VII large subunit [unclassified Campylobacter]|uniref:exodeoxyribonuclease VII large subunit n=1 Tax=unclassified Campylobacter TaxID=2593542 RepID=UPI0012381878|nr:MULTISPECIES: exodeoxyribonuclease VII large subunit [unclassified Campylobacter]KAA6227184.1 exodeoxyribonuclease VII large subunit [Campylobacter sp. LR286c]KAA6227942.1 exodeoxyribonuclease VII large subunit [Campylobacter sp. LR185c]KAA6228351.1 exodeoxyribonuclease VII large subunit [Campylobacter sp. LR196d]KAA6229352.1 exodeoxyribonuclease VII large subunit [Campylobacter sp. LR291e]KAA8604370.1 exodeoxyribonuclease VII large subunit [Campylobacter sp. LR185c]